MSKVSQYQMSGFISKKDKVIFGAICHVMGDDWCAESIKDRCKILFYKSNNTEVFSVDGIELIEFHPPQFSSTQGDLSVTITASQPCRLLYTPNA